MEYRIVELEAWDRKDLFQFYIQRMRIVMSLTVEMDVTPLVAFAKRQGMKFYPLMIWGVSKVVNAHDAFKYGWDPQGSLPVDSAFLFALEESEPHPANIETASPAHNNTLNTFLFIITPSIIEFGFYSLPMSHCTTVKLLLYSTIAYNICQTPKQ